MGRRSRVVETGGEAVWGREVAVVVVMAVECTVPHSPVVDKNQEGHLGNEQSQSQARLHSPGFQRQKDKPQLPLAVKTSGGWHGRKLTDFYCLEGLHGLRTKANPTAAAERVSITYKRWVS